MARLRIVYKGGRRALQMRVRAGRAQQMGGESFTDQQDGWGGFTGESEG